MSPTWTKSAQRVDMKPSANDPSGIKKPRLLFLAHRFPYPPNRGDRIRSYNLLRFLSDSFAVTLACPHEEPIESSQREHLDHFCDSIITCRTSPTRWIGAAGMFAKGRSLSEGLFRSTEIWNRVCDLQRTEPFDVAFVFCSSMFSYIRDPVFAGTHTIVDLVDVDSHKWSQMSGQASWPKSWIYDAEAKRVRALEKEISLRAHAVTLVSDDEAKLFDEVVAPPFPAVGVRNGVDAEYFAPSISREASPGDTTRPIRLVFTGVMDYSPNVEGMIWFCKEVLPQLRQRVDVSLDVVGRRPSRRVRQLDDPPAVNIVGAVPDVRPYLSKAEIAISPLHLARGIQNKVLEAMASGLPVVSTPQSAVGIDGRPGVDLLVASDLDEWCAAIESLASNPAMRLEMGANARRLVEEKYNWDICLNSFLTLLGAERATLNAESA